jgi:hypothetical protein
MAAKGDFYYLDAATLAQLKTDYTACLTSIATGAASYSIGGRSFTRANLAEVRQTLAEIAAAIRFQSSTGRVRTVFTDFR